MEAFARFKATSYVPLFIQCRTKFNTHRKKPIHLERRILEAITQPIYHENLDKRSKICSVEDHRKKVAMGVHKLVVKENLYENFLIREAQKVLDTSQVIIAFQPDSMNMRRKTAIHNLFVPIGLEPIYFPHDIIRKAIENTRLQNLHPLMHRQTLLVTGKSMQIKEMLDVTRKIPDLVLLGGIVGDRLFTKQGLIEYAAMPEIDGLRGQLVSILNALPQQTQGLLGAQQQALARNLDQYVKQMEDSTKSDHVSESSV